MKDRDMPIEAPPNPTPALIDWLMDAGPIEVSGGNRAPLSCAEIVAWQASSGVRLLPWQSKLLRRLSREYLAELEQAEDPQRQPPWRPEEQEEAGMTKDQALRAFLGMY